MMELLIQSVITKWYLLVKTGDLVKFAKFPHTELHKSDLSGLIIDGPYVRAEKMSLHVVDIMWNKPRPQTRGMPVSITWEYVDELELISESR